MDKQFCPDNGGFWTVAIEYMEGSPTTDPIHSRKNEKENVVEMLNEEERERFEHFKNIRRDISKDRNLPAYMVFSDRELAVLAKIPLLNEASAKSVKGVAPSKLKEYVNQFSSSSLYTMRRRKVI